MSDPALARAIELTKLAWQIGTDVARIVIQAIQAGDTKTLDALHAVLPSAAVLRARDEALRQAQRAKAAEDPRLRGRGR